MTDYPITTALISTDLAIGWQTALGLTVELTPIEESAHIIRSWNGRARNLAADEFKLLACTISSSEDMRPPAISRMWPGATFTMVPPAELSDVIQPGATSRTLIRPAYPGTVRCVTRTYEPVPFTLIGDRIVSLTAPATEPVRVYFRPILNLFVTEPWSTSTHEQNAEVSWSLTAEEEGFF
ncbi:hypothetical protein ABE562_04920 [Brucella intermedia]|uniref:Uncharacterized protein n=1 Tax=Brucella intermedia GD04153 TaxID=2975438 RepID=A0AA42KJ53_9HYPH|nr:hypothetical protein [Brucella intermedia]MDH0123308.1 hypothetical protein [Brucella intermedia GD04153]